MGRVETKKARHREREVEGEWEMNKEKRSMVQECVRKETQGIYICPLMGVC